MQYINLILAIPDSLTTIPETQLGEPVMDFQSNLVDEPHVPSQISTPAETNAQNIKSNTEEKKLVLGSGRKFSVDPFMKNGA